MSALHTIVTLPLNEAQRQLLRSAATGTLRFLSYADAKQADLSGVDSIIGFIPVKRLAEVPHLRWMQLGSVGAEPYIESVPRAAYLTNARGAYGQPVAEHAFALLLALMKQLQLYRDHQHTGLWQRDGTVASLQNATVLIVGMGDIGRHFAAMAKPFSVQVLAVRRRADIPAEGADETHPLSALQTLLPRADVVLLALPDSSETRGIIGAEELAAMKKTAYILNVGRGVSIDTDALCSALSENQIAGAGLDVTDPEPLPPAHPLWKQPNVLISPHTAGGLLLPATLNAITQIAAENLRRINSGQTPINIVNRDTGYAMGNKPV